VREEIPLLGVKFLVFLDFIVDGAGIIVGDISVCREEFLDISQGVFR